MEIFKNMLPPQTSSEVPKSSEKRTVETFL